MPFDNSRDEDLGSAAGAGPFAKLLAPAPVDEMLRVLLEARRLIEKPENWMKGTYCAGDSYCAHGALVTIAGDNWLSARGYLGAFAWPHSSAMGLNDAPATTHADVLGLFDRAIAARRAELAS